MDFTWVTHNDNLAVDTLVIFEPWIRIQTGIVVHVASLVGSQASAWAVRKGSAAGAQVGGREQKGIED